VRSVVARKHDLDGVTLQVQAWSSFLARALEMDRARHRESNCVQSTTSLDSKVTGSRNGQNQAEEGVTNSLEQLQPEDASSNTHAGDSQHQLQAAVNSGTENPGEDQLPERVDLDRKQREGASNTRPYDKKEEKRGASHHRSNAQMQEDSQKWNDDRARVTRGQSSETREEKRLKEEMEYGRQANFQQSTTTPGGTSSAYGKSSMGAVEPLQEGKEKNCGASSSRSTAQVTTIDESRVDNMRAFVRMRQLLQLKNGGMDDSGPIQKEEQDQNRDGNIIFFGEDESEVRSARAQICSILKISESRRRKPHTSSIPTSLTVGSGPASANAILANPGLIGKMTFRDCINGVQICVVEGDITQQKVDVIVNAVNGSLSLNWGVSGAISKAGGSSIQAECDAIIRQRSFRNLAITDCVWTKGGKLPCKFVIHAVGPHYSLAFGAYRSQQELHDTCHKVLRMAASELKAMSIAMPAISSGACGMPRDLCAESMFSAITDFIENTKDNSLVDICLIDNDRRAADVFSDAFGKMLRKFNASKGHLTSPNLQPAYPPSGSYSPGTSYPGAGSTSVSQGTSQASYGLQVSLSSGQTPTNPSYGAWGQTHQTIPSGVASVSPPQYPGPTSTYVNATSSSYPHGNATTPRYPHPTPNYSKLSPSSASGNSDKEDTCPICLCDFTRPVTTPCKHKFCADCLKDAMKVSGQCPVCKSVIGRLKGNQPQGTMTHRTDYLGLPGYEYCRSTIEIHYYFPDGLQGSEHPNPGKPYTGTSRRAYLPDNVEGREVLRLLQRAFDSRLVFTIGTSVTTGRTDTVVWNDIHHKTSKYGGPNSYGYPDPQYLTRVKEELAAKGINQPDLSGRIFELKGNRREETVRMKRTGCWLLTVICSVLGGVAATDVRSSSGPECLLQPWHTCVQNDIKFRDTFYHNMTCICTNCHPEVYRAGTCATLAQHGAFPPAQWVALRGVPVGNLSSQTLQNIHPSSLTVLVLINAGIGAIENKTFAIFPHLRSVYLDVNTLSQLKRASFSGLNTSHPSLAHLSFPHNRIAKLEPGCFEEAPYLTMLDLSHNLLSEVASDWFRGVAFLHTLILSNNKIKFISDTAFHHNLRVLNVSHNPLMCLSERILSGPSLQTFSVGGERVISWEQDDKMNWSLTVDKTDFPRKKQKVRLRIDNLGFCITYTTATRDFQLRWARVDVFYFELFNGEEPECSTHAFGPINIQPPFVVATTLKKPKSDRQLLPSSNLCPEAWTTHAGMTLALKGGVGLQLVGIHNTEKTETRRNDGIALISRYMYDRSPGFVTKSESSVTNVSCFVFFHGEVGSLPPSHFPGTGRGPHSECPDSKFPPDNPDEESTSTESNNQATDSATGYLEKSTDSTRLTTMIVNVLDPYRTLIPTAQSSATSPTAKESVSRYFISLIAVPGLVILLIVMVCKYRRSRNAAQNVPVQVDPCHQVIDVTQLISNPMYKTSNQTLAQPSGGNDLTEKSTDCGSSVHTYCEIKDEDVYNPTRTHRNAAPNVPGTTARPRLAQRSSVVTDEEERRTHRRFSTASTHSYEEVKDEDVYDPSTTHSYRNSAPSVPDSASRPRLAQCSSVVTDEEESRAHRRFSTVSTHSYEEVKDEDVYDPTSTHTYSEIRDEEVRGTSVNVVRVQNRKLSNTVQTGEPNVARTRGSRPSIDVTDLISNPMYKTSSAQPDCTDPKEQITCRHSSTLSTHSYCEIDDDDVYDPSSTHFYSEIKDEEAAGSPTSDLRAEEKQEGRASPPLAGLRRHSAELIRWEGGTSKQSADEGIKIIAYYTLKNQDISVLQHGASEKPVYEVVKCLTCRVVDILSPGVFGSQTRNQRENDWVEPVAGGRHLELGKGQPGKSVTSAVKRQVLWRGMWQATWLYLYLTWIRPMIKWFLRKILGTCELQRICRGYGGAARTKRLLQEATHRDVDNDVDQRVQDILQIKGVSQEKDPQFAPSLRACILQIHGYQELIREVEGVRGEAYSSDNQEHENMLLQLWDHLMPDINLESRITKQWGDIGFQGDDPRTDFRGMGMLGLHNLFFFADQQTELARQVLQHSHHPQYGYSFAIVGINITSLTYSLLVRGKLRTHFYNSPSPGPPKLSHFHLVYCHLLVEFDKFWLAEKPRDVMEFTRIRNKFEKKLLSLLRDDTTVLRGSFMEEGEQS
ncbi:ELMO domain-containing protein 1, partial [Branchiostoma belcheri]